MSLSFKVFFSPDNIRRIRLDGAVTYHQFTNLLHELYEDNYHPELMLKWKDEDGDLISVSSQIEWQHLLETVKENPIKIYVSEATNKAYFKDGPPAQSLGIFDSETKQKIEGEQVQRIEAAVPQFLQKLFRSDRILPYNLPIWLQGCITIRTLPNNELDLDINIHELLLVLHRRSLELLTVGEKESIEEGKRLLLISLDILPNAPLTLYNLACAESLLNNVSEANEALEKAFDHGYNNVEHMEQDGDLDNIRQTPRYAALVNRLKGISMETSTQASAVVEEPKPVEEQVDQVPKAVEEIQPKPVEEVKEEPQLSVGEQKWAHMITPLREMGLGQNDPFFGVRCVALFERFNGDIDAVIDQLFQNAN
eukprot:TRINITY_DN1208_c0_g1_i3.p1 TRINITY_DN1208_c0_g1~~TRINITY_DN1208_c0_g1_i3.p1  ORF type:complete len:366 (+),score=124.20 TRINITY_DN1208_c0_g1_i3:142-1239(+)